VVDILAREYDQAKAMGKYVPPLIDVKSNGHADDGSPKNGRAR
jgi:hypothetical protein